MRNALVAAILMSAALAAHEAATGAAAGQELRLGRPSPPELDEATFANDLASQLDEEISLLASAAEGAASPVLRQLLLARANARIVAQRLLVLGHQAGAEGSVAVLLGATLFNGRIAIDQSLAIDPWPADFDPSGDGSAAPAVPDSRFADAYWSLVRFNGQAMAKVDLLPADSLDVIDAAVAQILLPLREALESLESRTAVTHWVSDPSVAASGAPAGAGQEPADEPALADRLAAAPLPEETRAELLGINDVLKAAAEFPEFQRQATEYRRHIKGVIGYAEALAEAEWAPQAMRERALARLHAAVLLFKEKATRAEGQAQLARLMESRRTLEKLTHLSSLSRHRLRPTALERAFFSAEEMLADPARAAGALDHLARLHVVLERMIVWREMRDPQLRRELRVVCANLDRQYEQVEEELLAALEALPADSQFGADPNLLALLANHAQTLSDLEHVRSIPEWAAKVEALRPADAETFEARARRIAQWLIDPARRPEAVRSMNELAAQFNMFLPFPFEHELRDGTPEAAAITSGQHQALLDGISRERVQWIESWGEEGDGGESLPRLILLYRLMRAMADTVELSRMGGDAQWLNRWSAWELDTQAMAPSVSEVPSRLRLAVQAAVNGNIEDLERQLALIDAELPLAELIGRIAATIGPALRALPEDGLATVEQASPPPGGGNAWLSRRRIEIARICRYASEESFARSDGRTELADACAAYINALAQDLLRELAAPDR